MTKAKGKVGYRDIQAQIEKRIASGRLHSGDRVGPVRRLASEWGVSLLTADRALRELAQRGLLERVTRRGFFVAPSALQIRGRIHALVPTIDSVTPFPDLLDGIQREVWPRGYQLSICCTQWSIETALQAVQRALLEQTDGVLYAPAGYGTDFHRNREALAVLIEKNRPVVTLGHCRLKDFPELAGVSSDHARAGYDMTQHLLKQGAKRIALLGIRPNQDMEALIDGHRRALKKADRPFAARLIRTHEAGGSARSEIQYLAHLQPRPDAVFAMDDTEAAAVLVELQRLGLRVPEDMRVVGFGDYPIGRLVHPALTTMRSNLREIGRLAASMLMDHIEQDGQPVRRVELPCELIVRASCGGV